MSKNYRFALAVVVLFIAGLLLAWVINNIQQYQLPSITVFVYNQQDESRVAVGLLYHDVFDEDTIERIVNNGVSLHTISAMEILGVYDNQFYLPQVLPIDFEENNTFQVNRIDAPTNIIDATAHHKMLGFYQNTESGLVWNLDINGSRVNGDALFDVTHISYCEDGGFRIDTSSSMTLQQLSNINLSVECAGHVFVTQHHQGETTGFYIGQSNFRDEPAG